MINLENERKSLDALLQSGVLTKEEHERLCSDLLNKAGAASKTSYEDETTDPHLKSENAKSILNPALKEKIKNQMEEFAPLIIIGLLVMIVVGWGVVPTFMSNESIAPPTFDERYEYGLMVTQVRSIHHATLIKDRLTGKGIGTLIVTVEDESGDGVWHKLIIDTAKTSEEILQKQQEMEGAHGFDDLEIVQFNVLGRYLVDTKSTTGNEAQWINSEPPNIPKESMDTLNKFPYSNYFFVERLTLYATTAEGTSRKHSAMLSGVGTDLPRGISRKELLKETYAFSESILTDNLYGDQVTINVLNMRDDNGIVGDVISYYAQQILDTGHYDTEIAEPFSVDAGTELKGLKVIIEPKPNVFRTYILIGDAKRKWVYFTQSKKKNDDELKEVLTQIGQSKGLLEYAEFFNTFYTLPSTPNTGDSFLGFNMDRIGPSYARLKGYKKWAKRCVGNWQSTGYFHNEEKGRWSYSIFDLLTGANSATMYTDYTKDGPRAKQEVDVYGVKGRLVYEDRWSKRRYKSYKWPMEVNFPTNRYICMVNNQNDYGLLNTEMLIQRAHSLQLHKKGGYSGASVP